MRLDDANALQNPQDQARVRLYCQTARANQRARRAREE
jgi:hypothetical protein